MYGKKEYGDYQTPDDFAQRVCRYLLETKHISPTTILEPTCGKGSFLRAALCFSSARVFGIEINEDYCDFCRNSLESNRVMITKENILGLKTKPLIGTTEKLLIVGNPPWVTNSALTVLGGGNVPEKRNIKKVKGLEALTGGGNFDLGEAIILQLIQEYDRTETTVAMICKSSVARNVFVWLRQRSIQYSWCEMLSFDAEEVFGVSVEACVFIVQLSREQQGQMDCVVKSFDVPESEKGVLQFKDGHLYNGMVSQLNDYEGHCCFTWRQGVKHDCTRVMELSERDGRLVNGIGEDVDVESEMVYPLIKSSMFKHAIIHSSSKYVLLTQQKIGQDTRYIANQYPKTWRYLQHNEADFTRRRSSIYRNAPRFAMFGVGSYSFAPYKVGVSGFYKEPLFSLLMPVNHKPVLLDDTSYFLGFKNYADAYVAMLLLNEEGVQHFLQNISFSDAKRPFTKKVLERLDFRKMTQKIQLSDLSRVEQRFALPSFCTQKMYDDFKQSMPLELF